MDFKDSKMIIEKTDLDYILTMYLRSYLFYNKGKPPEAVVIPMVPGFKNPRDPKMEMIPVEFVEFAPEPVTPQEALELPAKAEDEGIEESAEAQETEEQSEEVITCEHCDDPGTPDNPIVFLPDGSAVHESCEKKFKKAEQNASTGRVRTSGNRKSN